MLNCWCITWPVGLKRLIKTSCNFALCCSVSDEYTPLPRQATTFSNKTICEDKIYDKKRVFSLTKTYGELRRVQVWRSVTSIQNGLKWGLLVHAAIFWGFDAPWDVNFLTDVSGQPVRHHLEGGHISGFVSTDSQLCSSIWHLEGTETVCVYDCILLGENTINRRQAMYVYRYTEACYRTDCYIVK